jgi:hypothetical protein
MYNSRSAQMNNVVEYVEGGCAAHYTPIVGNLELVELQQRSDEKLDNSNATHYLAFKQEQELIKSFLSEDQTELEQAQPFYSSPTSKRAFINIESNLTIVRYKLETDLKHCSLCNKVHSRTTTQKQTTKSIVEEQKEHRMSKITIDRDELGPSSSIIERINAVRYQGALKLQDTSDSIAGSIKTQIANLNRLFESLQYVLSNSDSLIRSHVDSIKRSLLSNCASRLEQVDRKRIQMHVELDEYKSKCSRGMLAESRSTQWANLVKFMRANEISSRAIDFFLNSSRHLNARASDDETERERIRKQSAELDAFKKELDEHKNWFYAQLYQEHKVIYQSEAFKLNKLAANDLLDGIAMCFSEHASTYSQMFSKPVIASEGAQSSRFSIANLLS